MTLGQEFGAYAVMIDTAMAALSRSAEELHELNMGATAIGTGINSPPGYADLVTKHLAEITGLPLTKAANLVEATQDSGAFAQMAGTMKRAAVQISKICNDLRWLSSGPRCGLERDQPPAHAARLVDHAGQGQPRHPRTGQPGLLPDHRLRRDDLDGVARPASSSSTWPSRSSPTTCSTA